jgi:RimJ/RimL family protein N-acetyltransferase
VRDRDTIAETERLILRRWREADREPFYKLNSDPRVMEYFPAALTREESNALAEKIEAHFGERGFGLCAAELKEEQRFIGFIGLAVPSFVAHFTPCVEIGWRLAGEYWGRGLATEGARRALRMAFEEMRLEEIVSFTVPENARSRRVMERIGMERDAAGDFDHPRLAEGHALRRHLLYRLKRENWEKIPG